MKKVEIKVLRKCFHADLAEEYLTDEKDAGPCPLIEEGDSFLYEGSAIMPDGFCPWAWIDVYRAVNAISLGATYTPWQKKEGTTIQCCPDGVRPVIFAIKAEEEIE